MLIGVVIDIKHLGARQTDTTMYKVESFNIEKKMWCILNRTALYLFTVSVKQTWAWPSNKESRDY